MPASRIDAFPRLIIELDALADHYPLPKRRLIATALINWSLSPSGI
jgi:hypothetical protein